MNWFSIASNALWILALALGLAFVGITYWESLEKKETLPIVLSRPKMQGLINLTLAIFSLGLGLSISPLWGKILWFILAFSSLITAWYFYRMDLKKK